MLHGGCVSRRRLHAAVGCRCSWSRELHGVLGCQPLCWHAVLCCAALPCVPASVAGQPQNGHRIVLHGFKYRGWMPGGSDFCAGSVSQQLGWAWHNTGPEGGWLAFMLDWCPPGGHPPAYTPVQYALHAFALLSHTSIACDDVSVCAHVRVAAGWYLPAGDFGRTVRGTALWRGFGGAVWVPVVCTHRCGACVQTLICLVWLCMPADCGRCSCRTRISRAACMYQSTAFGGAMLYCSLGCAFPGFLWSNWFMFASSVQCGGFHAYQLAALLPRTEAACCICMSLLELAMLFAVCTSLLIVACNGCSCFCIQCAAALAQISAGSTAAGATGSRVLLFRSSWGVPLRSLSRDAAVWVHCSMQGHHLQQQQRLQHVFCAGLACRERSDWPSPG